MKRFLVIFILGFLCCAVTVNADEVVLKTGEIVKGRIVERVKDYVKIDNGIGVGVTYYNDEISSINGESVKVETPPVAVYSPAPSQDTTLQQPMAPAAEAPAKVVEAPVSIPNVTSSEPVQTVKSNRSTVSVRQNFSSSVPSGKLSSPVFGILKPFLGAGIVVIFLIVAFFYVLMCMPLYLLARKTNTSPVWLAWIPLANLYLFTKVAQKPGWWILVIFAVGLIPFAGILADLIIITWFWCCICEIRQKPKWLGLLILVPFVNIALPWYVALSDEKEKVSQ
ncbi:MAG: hypothetical protein WCH62_00010 [Candidatus Omnitrophota bacterium]